MTSNDQNLWIGPRPGDVKGRTFPRMIHLKTTNPIESTFATVRLRQQVTKGPGSRAAGIAMAFKLMESAQTRWRAVKHQCERFSFVSDVSWAKKSDALIRKGPQPP